jgi:hypothetical protein
VALKSTTVDELLSHDGWTRRSGELHGSCCDGAVVATTNLKSLKGNFMMQLARTGALISIYGIFHFSAEFGEYDHVICDLLQRSSQWRSYSL